jgi:putative flippase GtrA
VNFKKFLPPQFKSRREFKILLKALTTSQVGAWVDFTVSLILFQFTPLGEVYSKAIGTTSGGFTNCFLNYKWTFKGNDVKKRMVFVKYVLVWLGSLCLNTAGTVATYHLLSSWQWLIDIGFKSAGFFMAAQLIVSFFVSVFWNITLQRYFVFQDVDIKGFLRPRRKKSK